jgi:guanine nucleotide-binding protein alpha-1 subunit
MRLLPSCVPVGSIFSRPWLTHRIFAQDTKATQAVLAGVRDGILRLHLEELNVI